MSPLRRTFIALLAAATVLFAIGVIAERSAGETHTESATAHSTEAAEAGAGEPAQAAHDEEAEGAAEVRNEQVLGIDVESTPLFVLAALAGLGLTAAAASRWGRLRWFLRAVAVIALAWAAFDMREVVHQLDESQTAIALVALLVAVLHAAAAAISVRLSRRTERGPV